MEADRARLLEWVKNFAREQGRKPQTHDIPSDLLGIFHAVKGAQAAAPQVTPAPSVAAAAVLTPLSRTPHPTAAGKDPSDAQPGSPSGARENTAPELLVVHGTPTKAGADSDDGFAAPTTVRGTRGTAAGPRPPQTTGLRVPGTRPTGGASTGAPPSMAPFAARAAAAATPNPASTAPRGNLFARRADSASAGAVKASLTASFSAAYTGGKASGPPGSGIARLVGPPSIARGTVARPGTTGAGAAAAAALDTAGVSTAAGPKPSGAATRPSDSAQRSMPQLETTVDVQRAVQAAASRPGAAGDAGGAPLVRQGAALWAGAGRGQKLADIAAAQPSDAEEEADQAEPMDEDPPGPSKRAAAEVPSRKARAAAAPRARGRRARAAHREEEPSRSDDEVEVEGEEEAPAAAAAAAAAPRRSRPARAAYKAPAPPAGAEASDGEEGKGKGKGKGAGSDSDQSWGLPPRKEGPSRRTAGRKAVIEDSPERGASDDSEWSGGEPESDEERPARRKAAPAAPAAKKKAVTNAKASRDAPDTAAAAGATGAAAAPSAKEPKTKAKEPKAKKAMWSVKVGKSGDIVLVGATGSKKSDRGVRINTRGGYRGKFRSSQGATGKSRRRASRRRGTADMGEGVDGMEEDLVAELGADMVAAVGKTKATGKKRKGACFRCGLEGHWASECPGTKGGKAARDAGGAGGGASGDDLGAEEDDGPIVRKPAAKRRATGAGGSKRAGSAAPAPAPTDLEADLDEAAEAADLAAHADLALRPAPSSRPLPPLAPGTPALEAVLRGTFHHEAFRTPQLDIIRGVLRGEGTLAVLPTGLGKSLLYQLPALVLARAYGGEGLADTEAPGLEGIERHAEGDKAKATIGLGALVVSPLVALMREQAARLPKGVRGAALWREQPASEATAALRDLAAGRLHILMVAPERLGSGALLAALASCGRIGVVCVDEAHCVTEWGHSFRPAYLRMGALLGSLPKPHALLALTATATPATAAAVCSALGLDASVGVVRAGSPLPACIRLRSLWTPGPISTPATKRELGKLLSEGDLAPLRSILVYVNFRETADDLAAHLRVHSGLQVSSYHAGRSDADRRRVQMDFSRGALKAVVATVAYGMGLDNRHVTAVVHVGVPRSLEDLVQQAGRAGRHLVAPPAAADPDQEPATAGSPGPEAAAPPPLSGGALSITLVDRSEFRRIRSLAGMDGVDRQQTLELCRVTLGLDPPPGSKTRGRAAKSAAAAGPSDSVLLDWELLADRLGVARPVLEGAAAMLEAGDPSDPEGGPLLRHQAAVKSSVEMAFYQGGPQEVLAALQDVPHEEADQAEAAARVLRAALQLSPKDVRGKYSAGLWDVARAAGMPPLEVLRALPALARRGARCRATGASHELYTVLRRPRDVSALADALCARLNAVAEGAIARADVSYLALASAADVVDADEKDRVLRAALDGYFSREGPVAADPEQRRGLPLREPSATILVMDIQAVLADHERNADGDYSQRFSARSVAKILHGLNSNDTPARIWARKHYWGSYADCDFAAVMVVARKEIRSWAMAGAKTAASGAAANKALAAAGAAGGAAGSGRPLPAAAEAPEASDSGSSSSEDEVSEDGAEMEAQGDAIDEDDHVGSASDSDDVGMGEAELQGAVGGGGPAVGFEGGVVAVEDTPSAGGELEGMVME